MLAARRSGQLPAARSAWAALGASAHLPDELCYALMIGSLFDAAGRRRDGEGDASDEGRVAERAAVDDPSVEPALIDEAMEMAATAASQLASSASPVVITAALGCSISALAPSAARHVPRRLLRVYTTDTHPHTSPPP